MEDPIYMAFTTHEGGVSKLILTALVASHLHYVLEKRKFHRDDDSKISSTGRNFSLLYLYGESNNAI